MNEQSRGTWIKASQSTQPSRTAIHHDMAAQVNARPLILQVKKEAVVHPDRTGACPERSRGSVGHPIPPKHLAKAESPGGGLGRGAWPECKRRYRGKRDFSSAPKVRSLFWSQKSATQGQIHE